MRTLFVVCSRNINSHAGEEYDTILEVPDQPTKVDFQDWANRIKQSIRTLWHDQKGENDPKVVVNLAAANPYHAILKDLQIIMKDEEGVVLELPYDKPRDIPMDAETVEMLRRLGERV